MISSYALRRISARSRGLRPAQPSNAPSAASSAAFASSTVALATEAILRSVAGSITSKRPPSDALRHLPPIQRSVGTLARRFSYITLPLNLLRSFSRKRESGVGPGRAARLTVQRPSHRFGDPVRCRQHGVFENIGCRQRNMRRRDADRRTIQIVKSLVGRDRNDLGAPPAEPRIFLDGEEPVRLPDRAEDGLRVERHERSHIDNLAIDAVFRLEPFGGLERTRHHQCQSADGGILAAAKNLGGTEAVDNLAVRNFALGGIERLVLEENHRIGIANRSRKQADDIARA